MCQAFKQFGHEGKTGCGHQLLESLCQNSQKSAFNAANIGILSYGPGHQKRSEQVRERSAAASLYFTKASCQKREPSLSFHFDVRRNGIVIEQCRQLEANGSCTIGSKCALKHCAAIAKGEGERDTKVTSNETVFSKASASKKMTGTGPSGKQTSHWWNITFFGLSVLSLSLLVWECVL